MDYIAQNIKFLRKKHGLTQDDMARKTGINRAQIGSYEEGRATPRLGYLQIIAGQFGLSLDILVNSNLAEEGLPKINYADTGINNLKILTAIVDSNNNERFAIVPHKATAGYTTGYSDPDFIEKLPVFDLPLPEFRNGKTYRVFQISGDSMAPIPSGSYIICEYIISAKDISYGEPHIVVTRNDGIVYKRIEKQEDNKMVLKLKSDNPEYKTYTVSHSEILEIWKAVGFISTRLPSKHDISQNRIQHLIADLKQELNQFGS